MRLAEFATTACGRVWWRVVVAGGWGGRKLKQKGLRELFWHRRTSLVGVPVATVDMRVQRCVFGPFFFLFFSVFCYLSSHVDHKHRYIHLNALQL